MTTFATSTDVRRVADRWRRIAGRPIAPASSAIADRWRRMQGEPPESPPDYPLNTPQSPPDRTAAPPLVGRAGALAEAQGFQPPGASAQPGYSYPPSSGVIEDVGRGLTRGVPGISRQIGGAVEAFAPIDAARQAGRSVREEAEAQIAQTPPPEGFVGQLAESIPSFGAAIGAGFAGAAAAPVIGLGALGAAALGIGTGAGVAGVQSGGSQFADARQRLVDRGVPEDEAASTARASALPVAVVSAVTNTVPIAGYLGRFAPSILNAALSKLATTRLGRVLVQSAAEGSQEAVEEVSSMMAQDFAEADPEAYKGFLARVGTAGAGGAILGGGASVAIDAAATAASPPVPRGTPQAQPAPSVQVGQRPTSPEQGAGVAIERGPGAAPLDFSATPDTDLVILGREHGLDTAVPRRVLERSLIAAGVAPPARPVAVSAAPDVQTDAQAVPSQPVVAQDAPSAPPVPAAPLFEGGPAGGPAQPQADAQRQAAQQPQPGVQQLQEVVQGGVAPSRVTDGPESTAPAQPQASTDPHLRLEFEAAGPGHKAFSQSLERVVADGSLSAPGADVIREAFRGTDDAFLGRVDVVSEDVRDRGGAPRAGRTLIVGGKAGGPTRAEITLMKGLAARQLEADPSSPLREADIEPAVTLLHEYGHAGFNLLMDDNERQAVTRYVRSKTPEEWAAHFGRGMQTKEDAARYAASTPEETFAHLFADYVISRRVPDARLKPLFERWLGVLKAAVERLRGRESTKELEPWFDLLLRGKREGKAERGGRQSRTPPAGKRISRASIDRTLLGLSKQAGPDGRDAHEEIEVEADANNENLEFSASFRSAKLPKELTEALQTKKHLLMQVRVGQPRGTGQDAFERLGVDRYVELLERGVKSKVKTAREGLKGFSPESDWLLAARDEYDRAPIRGEGDPLNLVVVPGESLRPGDAFMLGQREFVMARDENGLVAVDDRGETLQVRYGDSATRAVPMNAGSLRHGDDPGPAKALQKAISDGLDIPAFARRVQDTPGQEGVFGQGRTDASTGAQRGLFSEGQIEESRKPEAQVERLAADDPRREGESDADYRIRVKFREAEKNTGSLFARKVEGKSAADLEREYKEFDAQFYPPDVAAGVPDRKNLIRRNRAAAQESAVLPENIAKRRSLYAEWKAAVKSEKLRRAAAERANDPDAKARTEVFAALRRLGFIREHVSGASAYYRKGAFAVRVSDHDVPMSDERAYNVDRGGHSWADSPWSFVIGRDDLEEWLESVKKRIETRDIRFGRPIPSDLDSPEFRRWFGESKVVNDDGTPKVVYHGTPDARVIESRGVFETNHDVGARIGMVSKDAANEARAFFFVDHPAIAGTYADDRRAFDYQNAAPGSVPVYLSIRNPMVIDAKGKGWGARGGAATQTEQIDNAKRAGHDGIIIRNTRDAYQNSGREPAATVYVAFSPSQIKSATGNVGTFDPENPDIRFGRPIPSDLDSLGFYSRLERTAAAKVRQPMSRAQALKTLRGNGISDDELTWTGLLDLLEAKPDARLAPKALRKYLAENRVELREVVKGDRKAGRLRTELGDVTGRLDAAIRDLKRDFAEWARKRFDRTPSLAFIDASLDNTSFKERAATALGIGSHSIADAHGFLDFFDRVTEIGDLRREQRRLADRHEAQESPQFESFTLPGGENYREVLLVLPRKMDSYDRFIGEMQRKYGPNYHADMTGEEMETRDRLWESNNKTDAIQGGAQAHNTFRSSHFSEPNIIAHVRLKDRATPDGRKVLFVEEIQSDWHQQGREMGYRDDANIQRLKDRAEGLRAEGHALTSRMVKLRNDGVLDRVMYPDGKMYVGDFYKKDHWHDQAKYEEHQRLMAEQDALNKEESKAYQVYDTAKRSQIPPAPFSKTWHELAFRRVLRMAAEGGYDAIGWTTGEQQIDRYEGLASRVKAISWGPSADAQKVVMVFTGGGNISLIVDESGMVTRAHGSHSSELKGKSLADIFGKENAKRIMAERNGSMDGSGIRIGGEGMRSFYDRDLVNYAGKLGKRFGAKVEIEEVGIDHGEDSDLHSADSDMVHLLPVTPEMRESVVGEGTQLFARPIDDSPSITPEEIRWVREEARTTPAGPVDPARTRALRQLARMASHPVEAIRSSARAVELFLRTAEGAMRTMGPAGVELASTLRTITTRSNARYGRDHDDLVRSLKGLPKPAQRLAMLVMNGRRSLDAAPAGVRAAVDRVRAILDGQMNDADAAGFRRGAGRKHLFGIGHAFPEGPNEEGLAWLDAANRHGLAEAEVAKWAEEQVREGRAKNADEALANLLRYRDALIRGKNLYFEGYRAHLPERFVEWDPAKVLPRTLMRNAQFIEAAKVWGGPDFDTTQRFTKAEALIEKIGATRGAAERKILHDWFTAHFGGERPASVGEKAIGAVNNYETISKLGFSPLSALRNMGQRVANAPRYEYAVQGKALLAYPPVINRFFAESNRLKRLAERAGAAQPTEFTAIDERIPGGSLASTALKAAGFSAVEEGNRVTSAVMATLQLQRDIDRIMKWGDKTRFGRLLESALSLAVDPKGVRVRRTERAGMSPERLMRVLTDGTGASEEDLTAAMQATAEQTQFAQTLATEPLWWRTSPAGRLFWKFKTFGTRQMALIYRDVVMEARRGNAAPLVRWAIAMLLTGELYQLARDLLFGSDKSLTNALFDGDEESGREWAARVINSMKQGGGLGLVGDITYGIFNFAAGPTGSTVSNLSRFVKEAVYTPTQGGPRNIVAAAKEFVEREVPAVRQLEAAIDAADRAFINGSNRVREVAGIRQKARAFMAEVRDEGKGVGPAASIAGEALRGTLSGQIEYESGPWTLTLRQAAAQIDAGDTEDAAAFLARAADAADTPEKRESLKRAVAASRRMRSPLGSIRKDSVDDFLSSQAPSTAEAMRKIQREWLRDYDVALARAKEKRRSAPPSPRSTSDE